MTNREPRDRAALDRITGSHASRRTVVQGLAWTVPVVAVATSAPAFAASCDTFTFGPGSCKCPGQSTDDPFGYYLTICYTCPPGASGSDITINSVTKANGDALQQIRKNGACAPMLPATLKTGACTGQLFFTGTNSGNYLIINYTIDGKASTFKIPSPPNCSVEKCGSPDTPCTP